MSYEAERQAIRTMFKTPWEAGSNLPVQWPNIDFTPPPLGAPFLAFHIVRGRSTTMGLVGGGVARYRHPGFVQIDVSIAKNKGTRVGTELVDEVAAIFRGKRQGSIIFYAPEVREMLEPETSRVRFIVTIPFHRDENI